MKTITSLVSIFLLTVSVYSQGIERCNYTVQRPCGPDRYKKYSCQQGGVFGIASGSVPDINFCSLIGLGAGNTGCQKGTPEDCYTVDLVTYCDGSSAFVSSQSKATPHTAGGGSSCN